MNYISPEIFNQIHDDPRMAHIYNELFPKETCVPVSPRTDEDVYHFFLEAREYLHGVWPDWDPMSVKNYEIGKWAARCMNMYSCKYEKHSGFLYKKLTGRFYDLDDFRDVTDDIVSLADQATELKAKMIGDYYRQYQILRGLRMVCSSTFNRESFCDFIHTIYCR